MGSGAADAMMVGSDEALARVCLLGRDAAAAAAVAAAAARDRAPAARPSSSRPDARSCDAGEERCASGWERRRGRGAALCWAPAADPGETPTAPRGRRRFPCDAVSDTRATSSWRIVWHSIGDVGAFTPSVDRGLRSGASFQKPNRVKSSSVVGRVWLARARALRKKSPDDDEAK
jgi:hypothetical protein